MEDSVSKFPFDFWAQLAKDDPSAFEEARRLMIESLIEASPPSKQGRLRGLQWRIEQVRRRAATPLGACVKLSNLMWEQVTGDDGLIEHLSDLTEGRSKLKSHKLAAVIPLHPKG
ncbi:MAG: DUF3135 domain-containing protein [Gammaproteobacteria bacterium]|nr:DUF3135 domain-containing protein [Gammaproteobacteria bacterium]